MAEEALVQGLRVHGLHGIERLVMVACRKPKTRSAARSDPALRPARDPHHCDLMRGGFQTVQGSVAPGSESSTAGLTAKSLDSLGMAMLAIPKKTHECVRQ